VTSALTSITSPKYSFLYAEYDRRLIDDIYPSLPAPVKPNSSFKLAGKFKQIAEEEEKSLTQHPNQTTVTLVRI